jgi:ATP-binding cassette subfamily B protein
MNITSKVAIPDNPAPYKSHPKGMKIQVKDLTFGYHKESPPVIKDVNFTIDPGEIVSIVGYNGSGKVPAFQFLILGKSTIIRLLALLETPTSGNIYINDIEIREYEPQTIRTNMSILFQDFRTFHLNCD